MASCTDVAGTVHWTASVKISSGASGSVGPHTQPEYASGSASGSVGGHAVTVSVYTYAPGYPPLCAVTATTVH